MRRSREFRRAIACSIALAFMTGCGDIPSGGGGPTGSTEPSTSPGPTASLPGEYVDDGFGADGYTRTIIGTGNSECRDIAIQPDGKIILAGNSYLSGQSDNFALVRYGADGYVDTGFGTSGIVITDFSGDSDTGMAVGIQSSGKIVVAGRTYRKENGLNLDYFCVARYNQDGTIDTGFGTEGTGMSRFTAGSTLCIDMCSDMEIVSGDSIVVCGYCCDGGKDTGYDIVLAKLTAGGALDATFGSGGIVTQDLGQKWHELTSGMAVDPDGNIAVCGGTKRQTSTPVDEFVALFTPSGALNASFNGTGSRVINLGSEDVGDGVDFQADGKIVMTGTTNQSGLREIILQRFTTAGAPDPSFGASGTVVVGIGGTTNSGTTVLALPSGKIVVVGDTYVESESDMAFLVARYGSNGALDTGFASGGIAKHQFVTSDVNSEAIALAGDGAYIVAGSKEIGTSKYCFCMARYAP